MIINIGRNKKNDVVIENLSVSNNHAQLLIDENEKVFINDLQSENGTFVNGKIINDPTELNQNDVVKIANSNFDWKKHIPEKKSVEVPFFDENKNEKNNNLLLILLSIIIAITIIMGLFFYNEIGNNTDSFDSISNEKTETQETTSNNSDDIISDEINSEKKNKPNPEKPVELNQNITYDYVCLEDEKDRGTTNLINVFSEIGDEMVEIGTEEISLKEEIDYAVESHKRMKEEFEFINDNRTSNLKSILNKLTKKIKNPVGYNYKIYFIKDETINAYTTGGGYIYFFEGMYEYLKSNDEIAAIIGHEIHHNELGHIKDYLRIQKTNNSLFGEIGNIITSVQSVLTLSFNQRKETECDLHGIDLCANAGYKMCATPSIWKRMKKEENDFNTLENLFRTHPYSEKRESCAKNHLSYNYKVNCR